MNEEERPPILGAIGKDAKILLTGAPNGGWTVHSTGDRLCEPQLIGAYTTAGDMISALLSVLCAGDQNER